MRALLSKNWIYYKRQYLVSIFELLMPLLLMLIMLYIRTSISVTKLPSQNFEDLFVSFDTNMAGDSTYMHYPLIFDPIDLNFQHLESESFNFLGINAYAMY